MKVNLDLSVFVDSLAMLQGIIFAFILFADHKRKHANILLAIFLVCFSLDTISSILEEIEIISSYPVLEYLPFSFFFLNTPLLFLYTKSLTNNLNWKKDKTHLLPGILEFIFGTSLFLLLCITGIPKESIALDSVIILYFIGGLIFMIYYSVKLFMYVRRFNKQASDYYSNMHGKSLRWTYRLAILNILLGVFGFLSLILLFEHEEIAFLIMSVVNLIFVYWVSIGGFKQTPIELEYEEQLETHIEKPHSEKQELSKEYQGIIECMEKEKPYIECDLMLPKLAEMCGINQRNLSKAIKEHEGLNFNQFVNKYRVEETKRLLIDSSLKHLSIEGIGELAGFNSKATFYAAFKKMCGVSPSTYQDSKA